jgi:hypothetical protein
VFIMQLEFGELRNLLEIDVDRHPTVRHNSPCLQRLRTALGRELLQMSQAILAVIAMSSHFEHRLSTNSHSSNRANGLVEDEFKARLSFVLNRQQYSRSIEREGTRTSFQSIAGCVERLDHLAGDVQRSRVGHAGTEERNRTHEFVLSSITATVVCASLPLRSGGRTGWGHFRGDTSESPLKSVCRQFRESLPDLNEPRDVTSPDDYA